MYDLQNMIPTDTVILYVLVCFNLSMNLISRLRIILRASMQIKLFHFYELKVAHFNKSDGKCMGNRMVSLF